MIATDDVVIRYRVTDTYEGTFVGVEPTDAEIERVGFIQFHVADG